MAAAGIPASRADLVRFRLAGRVARVNDGDTAEIRLADGAVVALRFSDIDAPETGHGPERPGQPGARHARTALRQLLPLGHAVRAECYERDRYDRAVCHVFVGAVNANLEQLRGGWAMLPRRAAWVRDPESPAAEGEARRARRGLWASAAPVHPDDWRQRCWERRDCPGAE
ncbi:MAG: thermonuclease family protein [Rhodospirillales bacterium]|nr:thermonuclease family protein [Rhodospirillales bacterium]